MKGDYFLDSAVSPQVVETLMKLPGKETKINDALYATLTAREQEVLRLLAEGGRRKQGMAERVGLRSEAPAIFMPWGDDCPASMDLSPNIRSDVYPFPIPHSAFPIPNSVITTRTASGFRTLLRLPELSAQIGPTKIRPW